MKQQAAVIDEQGEEGYKDSGEYNQRIYVRCPRRGCGFTKTRKWNFGSASGERLMSLGWDRNYSRESAQDRGGPGHQLHQVGCFWDGLELSAWLWSQMGKWSLVSPILVWLSLSVWGLLRGSSGSELARPAS